MEIIKLLDEIEEEIKGAKRMPMTAKLLLEPEGILERLDRIRAVLPEEIEAAQMVISERERIFEEAKKEARYILDDSKYQASRLVSDDEITRNANQIAEEMLLRTDEAAREIRGSADEYAENLLKYLQSIITESLNSVNQGLKEISEHYEKD
ncbi:MAG: hypothetical protein GXY50_07535 [Syntrophomonadaceae bacterium]|nr:hypothetical protein [Syntrophomonadaceae bacterium]